MKRLWLALCAVVSCTPVPGSSFDDEGLFAPTIADAGSPTADAGPVDSGRVDAGGPDGGSVDGGLDAGDVLDGSVDAGTPPDGGPAPALSPYVETPFIDQVTFLAASQGADAGFEAERIAVVRGLVRTRAGAPMSMVRVTCLDHPEWGTRLTDAAGAFDFVVNGGGALVFSYEAAGHLTVQRRNEVPWNDFSWLPDIVMTPVDVRATPIRFGAMATQLQVAESSPSTDDAGTRVARVFFRAGTQATAVSRTGVRTPLASGTFRATEYTVGPTGPAAMPGELPATTAYTYAIELGFDETQDAATVEFDRPVLFYVDEFQGFPVGTRTPVGFYDRVDGRWEPEQNSLTLKVIGVANGLAELDVTGDGQAETAMALMAEGIEAEERAQVALLWPVGKTLTRAALRHFSPGDINGPPVAPDPNATPPPFSAKRANQTRRPNCQAGSVISCERQGLGESIELTGVPFVLEYSSERSVGYRPPVIIPLTGPGRPPGLISVVVELEIAGQRHRFVRGFAPNDELIFTWDGRDGYGRLVVGPRTLRGRTGYEFPISPAPNGDASLRWARVVGIPQSVVSAPVQSSIILWNDWNLVLGASGQPPAQFAGWRPSAMEPYRESTLAPARLVTLAGVGLRFTGTGGPPSRAAVVPVGVAATSSTAFVITDSATNTLREAATVVTTLAGAGTSLADGRALDAQLDVRRVRRGPDGSLYLIDGNRVRRVRPSGAIDTVAGQAGVAGFAGDGTLGIGALLNTPSGLAIAPDGTVFIADTGNHRVRRVSVAGIISTVAGLGTCGDTGDGALATLAQLCQPDDVVVLPGGALAMSDKGNHRLRRIDSAGLISALAGTGTMGTSGDNGPALAAHLLSPGALAFDGADALFVATGARIRRVHLSTATIDAFAGNGAMATTVTNGVPATSVPLGTVTAMDWTASGLLVADSAAERVRLVRTTGLIDTVAGAGPGADGTGGPATRALVETPVGLAFGPDGTVYVSSGHAVMKVAPDGTWQVVAGRRDEAGFSGDGADARGARLSSPDGLALARDGSLYIADKDNHRVRRVSPSGVISTVAGTGVPGFSGDEGPGVLGQLSGPRGVAVDGEGVVLIADTGNHRIRRLEADGRLSTLVGTGVAGFAGDGVGVRATVLNAPADVSVGPSGDVYIADSGNQRVRRISPLGQVWTVMGRTGCTGATSGLAVNACLSLPTGVFATTAGVYVTDAQTGRVWLVDDGGQLSLVAGNGGAAFSGDSGAATQASLRQPRRAGVMASGLVVVADTGNARVRTVVTARGVRNAAEVAVPSSDGSLVHIFRDSTKQHLRTVSARTGRVVASFDYDALGRVTAMTDDEGRRTTVSWDVRGPTSVTGPYGDVNRLTVDSNGYLSRVDKPGGESVQLAHTATGLLTDMVDETGARHTFQYEPDGRLKQDNNPVGGLKALAWSRTVTTGRETETVTLRTAANRLTAYETTRFPDGQESKRTTWPDGTESFTRVALDDSTVETSPDGTVTTTQLAPHARFGTLSPVAGLSTVRLPSGLTRRVATSTAVGFVNDNESFGLASESVVVTVNGRAFETTWDSASRTWTARTPAGRVSRVVVDEKERPLRLESPDDAPVTMTYAPDGGQLASVTQGTRTSTFAYGPNGLVSRATDALQRPTAYTYSSTQRVDSVTAPTTEVTRLGFDGRGRLTGVTPPDAGTHVYGYTPAGQLASYAPPPLVSVAPESWQYSSDLLLASQGHADGQQTVVRRDAAGRVASVQTPWHTTDVTYVSATGQVSSLRRSGRQVSFLWDGPLLTSESTTGLAASTWAYDADFRVASHAVNGASVARTYDADGLLTSVGPVALARAPSSGRLSSTTVGLVTTSFGYSQYGEVQTVTTSVAGTVLYSQGLQYDAVGNPIVSEETLSGTARQEAYSYDAVSRLTGVTRNGVSTTFAYGPNSTRIRAGGDVATFDAQDRLLAQGSTTYTWDVHGNRATDSTGVTYTHDGLGRLIGWRKGPTSLEYEVDALDRRVLRRRNGVVTARFVYEGQYRIVAELGSGSRFLYATHGHSPDAMVRAGVTYVYVKNHLGSVRAVVNGTTGQVVQALDYDVWGSVLADSSPGFQPFAFAGGLYDIDSKLTHFGWRDYDASTGTWSSPEPLLQEPVWVASEIQAGRQVPAYSYARNNPVRNTDPTGLAVPCNPGETSVACCLKNNPLNPMKCVGEGNESLIPGLAECAARAKAAYDVCIASGKSEAICETAASIVLAKCLAEKARPGPKTPLNCGP